jgi:hypothetical protein
VRKQPAFAAFFSGQAAKPPKRETAANGGSKKGAKIAALPRKKNF